MLANVAMYKIVHTLSLGTRTLHISESCDAADTHTASTNLTAATYQCEERRPPTLILSHLINSYPSPQKTGVTSEIPTWATSRAVLGVRDRPDHVSFSTTYNARSWGRSGG